MGSCCSSEQEHTCINTVRKPHSQSISDQTETSESEQQQNTQSQYHQFTNTDDAYELAKVCTILIEQVKAIIADDNDLNIDMFISDEFESIDLKQRSLESKEETCSIYSDIASNPSLCSFYQNEFINRNSNKSGSVF